MGDANEGVLVCRLVPVAMVIQYFFSAMVL